MSRSHLQTRILIDGLNRVDAILASRRTRLVDSEERRRLTDCFAPKALPEFDSWAFTADQYEMTVRTIKKRAPEVLPHLKKPLYERDFTIAGHCNLDLQFRADPHGKVSIPHVLQNGNSIKGARVRSEWGRLYSNGLISLPTHDGKAVFLFQPDGPYDEGAAIIASSAFMHRGEVETKGLAVTFPKARTNLIPDYSWVTRLNSEDGQYGVGDGCVNRTV
jgi:hypothetical protein